MSDYYLLFKWGTLKGWKVPEGECFELLKKAMEGSSLSAMEDNPDAERRKLICDLIDRMDSEGAEFSNDWSGEKYTAERAKSYIMEYRA